MVAEEMIPDWKVIEIETGYYKFFLGSEGHTIEQMARLAIEQFIADGSIDGGSWSVVVCRMSDMMQWRFVVERRTFFNVKGLRGEASAAEEYPSNNPTNWLDFARH